MIRMDLIAEAARTYHDAKPFPHLVVDGFFEPDFAREIAESFPHPGASWDTYDNPLEVKKTMNAWGLFPPAIYQAFQRLNDPGFVVELRKFLNIHDLVPDLGLHGGGLHLHGRGGKLNVHLDYATHPKLGLARKLNLIVYLSPAWQEPWGGALGLYEDAGDGPGALVKTIACRFNRAVIFDTTRSWHGLPEPIECPAELYRKSIATYYLTPANEDTEPRQRALFAPHGEQAHDPDIINLIKTRAGANAWRAYRTRRTSS